MAKRTPGKTVATLTHGAAARKNIPTAEYQAVMADDDRNPIQVACPTPAKSAATTLTASPAGSSTPITMKRASSSATPISSAPTTRTRRSRTTLKAESNETAWATLRSDTSRPFAKPQSGRIAVKVINHLEDEVMKVFRV